MTAELLVAARFCGPPRSANGGYFAGLVARHADRTMRVRLRVPPPLDTKLTIERDSSGRVDVLDGAVHIADAEPTELVLDAPPAVDYLDAIEASRHYNGFRVHAFPTCFVCGPQRSRGDGLRIFAGPVRTPSARAGGVAVAGLVAAPWVPDETLAETDGKIAPELISAALDCPGFFAVSDGRAMLLAEFTVHIDRRVHADESCVVVGWPLGSSGRKHQVGTALYDDDGELCARALALWIEPKPGA